jgi:hypothetical protein
MPKTSNGRRKGAKPTKPTLSLDQFCEGLADKNNQLLEGFLAGIRSGDIHLELEHNADDYIDLIVNEWCDTEEPNRHLHLRMISALYIWMLLDELYAEEIDDIPQGSPEADNSQHPGVVITIEVLKTVQAVWGRK